MWQCVRSPHVRGNALLGRRRSGLGRGGARLRGDMAKPTEVGRVASLKPVGSNATLVKDGIEAVIRGLKAQLVGEIEVAGLDLAGSLTVLGLMMVFDLPPPHRTWSWKGILRRPPAAALPCDQRS